MPLSPADFYAYSRATGTEYPEDPQSRAALAPEVAEWRRNQLKAPRQESDAVDTAGKLALGAGIAAGAYGLSRGKRFDRLREFIADAIRPKDPGATGGITQTQLQKTAQAAAPAVEKVAREGESVVAASKEITTPSQQVSPRQFIEQRGFVEPTLTESEQSLNILKTDQFNNAVQSSEDQMTGRVRQQLQRNENINLKEVDFLEDVNSQNIESMMEMGDPTQMMGYEPDAPINQAARQATGAVPKDQAESFIGPITAQETLELAKEEMIQRRQVLLEQGFKPGTTRFERALAQPFRTNVNIQPGMTGSSMQQTTLPAGPMRQTLQEVSSSEYLPERSVPNIGPEAVLTQAASGTSIRGASPAYLEQTAQKRTRQIFGAEDVLVPGAPNELMVDRPARETALQQIISEPGERIDEYAVRKEKGGLPGIGVYGIETGFTPGAQSKVTGEYSAAATRKPTDLPYKEKTKGFEALNKEQLASFVKNAPEGTMKQAGIKEQQRREASKESMVVSEAMRRARIEGRDPQMVLREMGFGV